MAIRHGYTGFGFVRATLGTAALMLGAASAQAQMMPIPEDENCGGDIAVIFVHGGAGSAGQYESQAMRFDSNGIGLECVRYVEYNSGAVQMILPQVLMQIDAQVADLQADGVSEINLVGHSLGTSVSQSYLSTPERAANIANYANVDGGVTPLSVPVVAVFAGAARDGMPQFPGADLNVVIPDQEHVEAVTSRESFVAMFQQFTGQMPVQDGAIVPATTDTVPVSGRVANFPANSPVPANLNPTVLAFELDPATARRTGEMMGMFAMPLATRSLDAGGFFDSIQVTTGAPMEFVLMRDGQGPQMFFKPQGYLRPNDSARLLTGDPDTSIVEQFTTRDPEAAAFVISRFREFRGVSGGMTRAAPGTSDSIVVSKLGRSTELISQEVDCCFVGVPVALLVQDSRADGVDGPTMGGQLPFIGITDKALGVSPSFIPFQVTMVPRGDVDSTLTFMLRSVPSTFGSVSVLIDDFVQ